MIKISEFPVWIIIVLMLISSLFGAYLEYAHGPRLTEKNNTETIVIQPFKEEVKVESQTSSAVQPITKEEQKGLVVQYMAKDGKVFAVIDGKDYPIKAPDGVKDIKLGENGYLEINNVTTVKIDFTDELNARLKTQIELEYVKWQKDKEKEIANLKIKHAKENIIGDAIAFGAGYLAGRASR